MNILYIVIFNDVSFTLKCLKWIDCVFVGACWL